MVSLNNHFFLSLIPLTTSGLWSTAHSWQIHTPQEIITASHLPYNIPMDDKPCAAELYSQKCLYLMLLFTFKPPSTSRKNQSLLININSTSGLGLIPYCVSLDQSQHTCPVALLPQILLSAHAFCWAQESLLAHKASHLPWAAPWCLVTHTSDTIIWPKHLVTHTSRH